MSVPAAHSGRHPAAWRPRLPRLKLTSARERALVGVLMMLPALVLFGLFAIYPMLRVFYLSLFNYNLTSDPIWVGLANFTRLASDPVFRQATANTLVYIVGTYVPTVVIALVLALALNHTSRVAGALRTIYFVPVAMSWVSVAVIWRLIYNPSGLLNQTFHLHANWLTDTTWAPLALVIMSIWKEVGFFVIIFLAGLQSISADVYEAARIDGAGIWALQRHITLPLLRPVMGVATIFGVIRGMQAFTPQYATTGGGPNLSTEVLNLFVYKTAFVYAQMGRASAVAVLLFLALLVVTLLQFRFFRSQTL